MYMILYIVQVQPYLVIYMHATLTIAVLCYIQVGAVDATQANQESLTISCSSNEADLVPAESISSWNLSAISESVLNPQLVCTYMYVRYMQFTYMYTMYMYLYMYIHPYVAYVNTQNTCLLAERCKTVFIHTCEENTSSGCKRERCFDIQEVA